MCLVIVAHQVDDSQPLIVAGNRDEFHARPAQAADWWPDDVDILGGRDLQAGGTWLALHRSGRFATVTNFRDAEPPRAGLRSRGHLVSEFVGASSAPLDYLRSIDGSKYAGFNLLVADGHSLAYLSNRDGPARELAPGVYGLSNATLDTRWEKVERSRTKLQALLETRAVNESSLLHLLGDRSRGPTKEVKSTRLPFATAHAMTAPFIVLPDYGTRCSTVVIADEQDHWTFIERRFDAAGRARGESRFFFHTVNA